MSVVARRVVSSPIRTATETWSVITNILAPSQGAGRTELAGIAGVACSLIASEATGNDAIVIWGNGPRVRVYCLFGDSAVSAEDKNEEGLATCPTEKDWSMSLPCPAEDLSWVQAELKSLSSRVTARKLGEAVPEEQSQASAQIQSISSAVVDEEAFFRS
jgi:hypothetical protein